MAIGGKRTAEEMLASVEKQMRKSVQGQTAPMMIHANKIRKIKNDKIKMKQTNVLG